MGSSTSGTSPSWIASRRAAARRGRRRCWLRLPRRCMLPTRTRGPVSMRRRRIELRRAQHGPPTPKKGKRPRLHKKAITRDALLSIRRDGDGRTRPPATWSRARALTSGPSDNGGVPPWSRFSGKSAPSYGRPTSAPMTTSSEQGHRARLGPRAANPPVPRDRRRQQRNAGSWPPRRFLRLLVHG
jgi:hypothetical protein